MYRSTALVGALATVALATLASSTVATAETATAPAAPAPHLIEIARRGAAEARTHAPDASSGTSGALTQSVGQPACVLPQVPASDPVDGVALDVASFAHLCEGSFNGVSITTTTPFSDAAFPGTEVFVDADGNAANGVEGAEYVAVAYYDTDFDELVAAVLRSPTANPADARFISVADAVRTSATSLRIMWPEWAMASITSLSFHGNLYQGGNPVDRFPNVGNLDVPQSSVPAPASPWGPSRFVPLASPARLLDTRIGLSAPVGTRPANSVLDLPVLGQVGVPNDPSVTAVAMNVTAVNPTRPGYVQVFPTGQAQVGEFSNLNPDRPGQTTPNMVVVPVGTGGKVSIYTEGGADLLADVAGYFVAAPSATAGRFQAVGPVRVLDTRTGNGGPAGARAAGSTTPVNVGSVLPAGGSGAVVLNVTAVSASTGGFVTAYPNGQPQPNASNLNLVPGQTVPNLVVVPVGAGGVVNLFTSATTHLLVDVLGTFTDASAPGSTNGLFVPIKPSRLRDTRAGYPQDLRAFADESVEVPVRARAAIPATGVSGVLLNVTAVQVEGNGYVSAFASESPLPNASNLNYQRAGQTIANAAVVRVGSSWVSLYTSEETHLLADAFGYFIA